MRTLAFACALFLAACAGTPETRATNAVAIACDGYAVALSELASFKSRLTPEHVAAVNKANGYVDAVCLPGAPVTAGGLETVRQATALLALVKGTLP